jgi:hypothetical protein
MACNADISQEPGAACCGETPSAQWRKKILSGKMKIGMECWMQNLLQIAETVALIFNYKHMKAPIG